MFSLNMSACMHVGGVGLGGWCIPVCIKIVDPGVVNSVGSLIFSSRQLFCHSWGKKRIERSQTSPKVWVYLPNYKQIFFFHIIFCEQVRSGPQQPSQLFLIWGVIVIPLVLLQLLQYNFSKTSEGNFWESLHHLPMTVTECNSDEKCEFKKKWTKLHLVTITSTMVFTSPNFISVFICNISVFILAVMFI